MNCRFRLPEARLIRTISLVPAGALVLTAFFLAGTGRMTDDRKNPTPIIASATAQADPSPEQITALTSAEQFRFIELARTTLFPGAISDRDADASLRRLASELLDKSLPLKIRRQAAWNLAKLGSPQALELLRRALSDAPVQLRATIAEALGKFDSAEARTLLHRLLIGDNDTVARGAIRGLAAVGDTEALQLLSTIFLDSQRAVDLRGESALALGKVDNASANAILLEGLSRSSDPELAETVLAALAERPFAETESFFRAYLSRADVPVEMRIAALEALGQSDGNPAPLLLQHLASDDESIRAASAAALALLESPSHVAPELLRALSNERSGEVRTRLYQALENQSNFDSEALLSAVLNDPAPESRIAGLKLLAAQAARPINAALAVEFDRLAVPQLEQLAIHESQLHYKLAAVMALKQAKTPAASQALSRVAAQSAEPRIVAAAKQK